MSIITKNIKISGDKGTIFIDMLVDTGASYSFIRKDKAKEVATILRLPEPMKFELAQEKQYLEVKERIIIDFFVNGDRLSDEFLVADNLSEESILGAKTMQAWKIKIDMEKEDIVLENGVGKLKLV